MGRAEQHQRSLVLWILGHQLVELLDLACDVGVRAGDGGENHQTLTVGHFAESASALPSLAKSSLALG